MSKAITGLLFLTLVFGAYSTTSTIISGAASTVFDSTSDTDTGKTFAPDYTAVGPGAAATTQYLYGVADISSGASTLDVNTITVDATALTGTQGDYYTAAATVTTDTGNDPLQSFVLVGNELYVLITKELDTDTHKFYAYHWAGASDTNTQTVGVVSLGAASGVAASAPAIATNAWYAAEGFYVTVIQQALTSGAYTDTAVGVYGLDTTTTPAAISEAFSFTLATPVTSTAAGAVQAKGGCNTATACTTVNVIYTDGTDFIVQPLTDGAQGTAITLTLPTATEGTTTEYETAGTVGLSSGPLYLLSRSQTVDSATTYDLVAFEETESAYTITPGSTATSHIMVYWSAIANGNTEPSIITTYTTASGTTYDYVYTTVGATAVGKSYTFGTFTNAPTLFVDAADNLWCGWTEGTTSVTTAMVAPLGSSILMSAIAFVSMIVMTLFMF